jgi:putative ABC transport system permease protein
MDGFRQDVRAALATMRRAPGFAATALITLALGVGAATAVFSIVHGVLLRPLPYPDSSRLIRIWEEHPGGASPAGNRWLSRSTYAGWRERAHTLGALGGYALYEYRLGSGANRFKIFGAPISPAVLDTLGATPALGRFFVDDDDREGAPKVVIVSHQLWRERYASDPAIVGRSIVIDGDAYTIVGVARPSLEFPDPRVRAWMPYVIPRSAAQPTGAIVFTSLARMKPGVSLAQVEAEGTASARAAAAHRLTELFFGKGGPPIVHARRLVDDMTAQARPALSVMAAAVALLLLIACANVANLMLSRSVARQRELAIRAAIGGSRARIVRQLFTESAVFSIAGGSLGLLLAWWLVRVLPAVAPAKLPRLDAVSLDGSVVAFCALATFLAALVVGLAPAARGAHVNLFEVFRGGDGSSSTGFRGAHGRRLRDGLLVVEAALAVILIVGASLLARSFIRLVRVDNGYVAEGVLIASTELPIGTTEGRIDEFINASLARLRALHEVSSAGAGGMIPLMLRTAIAPFRLPDAISGAKPTRGRALVYWVTPGYAEALGLRLRQGRLFIESDAHTGVLPTIVNEEFLRRHVSASQAIGLRLPGLVSQGVTAEIVGVVSDVLKDGNDGRPQPELYFVHGSHGQRIGEAVHFVIRTTGSPAALAPAVRSVLRNVEPDLFFDRIEPLTTTVAASLEGSRFAAAVMAGFAGLAMLLAAIGLYGVMSYGVSQRVRELGIRAALGARRADLVRLVLREGLSVAFAGIALGLLAAVFATRLTQDLLFGVTPRDPIAFTIAPALLALASIGACLGPALRAASTDPTTTLRAQ